MKTPLWFAALAVLALPALALAEECPSKTTCAEGMVWDTTKAQCVLKPTS